MVPPQDSVKNCAWNPGHEANGSNWNVNLEISLTETETDKASFTLGVVHRPIVARNSARFAYYLVIPVRPRANLTESLKSEWIGFLWRVTRPQLVYVEISWHWSTSQQHWFFFIVHFPVYSSGCKRQVSVCLSAVFTGVVCLLSITTDNFEVCSCVSLHIGFLCFKELSATLMLRMCGVKCSISFWIWSTRVTADIKSAMGENMNTESRYRILYWQQ